MDLITKQGLNGFPALKSSCRNSKHFRFLDSKPAKVDSSVNTKSPKIIDRTPALFAILSLAVTLLACAKWQPGYFDKPTKTETHGRITEKQYYEGNYYSVLEVDGKPIKIPNGYVDYTSYCDSDGIDAVIYTVRGKPGAPGIFVLQVHGKETIRERLSDYCRGGLSVGIWKDGKIEVCETGWDAINRKQYKPSLKPAFNK